MSVTIVPKEVENLDTLDLCQSLNITRSQFLKIMSDMKDRRRNPGYSRYTNQLFMSQLSAEECGVFQEKLFKTHRIRQPSACRIPPHAAPPRASARSRRAAAHGAPGSRLPDRGRLSPAATRYHTGG